MSTPQELIEKATKGEIETDELKTKLEEFSDEEKLQFSSLAKEQSESILSEFSGLTKEKQRRLQQLEDLGNQAQPSQQTPQEGGESNQGENPLNQFREEQVLKAKSRLKEQFGLSDEDVAKVEEKFGQVDSGKVDADLIYEDFVGAYAFVNKDSLLSAQQKNEEMQQSAVEATVSAAGSTSNQPSNDANEQEYPEEAKQLAKDAGISEDAALKQLQGGMRRTY